MVETKQVTDKKEWDVCLKTHPEANFLQSWEWGAFHERIGHTIERTGFYQDNTLVGVMLSVVEPAKRGRYVTVPGGPIIDWKSIVEEGFKPSYSIITQTLQAIGKKHRCVFVRVRPQLLNNDESREMFKTMGFILAPIHLHAQLTLQLDLTKSEEELMMDMRKNTRYALRKALSGDIKVEKTTDPASIQAFYELQRETAQRQKFVPFSYSYLHEQFTVFAVENMAYLYSSYHQNKLLAQAFIIFYGDEAVYHYGASTQAGREYPGAYILQWEAIQEAKRRGMKRYNFWGITHEHEKNHRFYGLSIFKRGFGGEEVEYLPAQDLILNKPLYLINTSIEQLRKKMRRV